MHSLLETREGNGTSRVHSSGGGHFYLSYCYLLLPRILENHFKLKPYYPDVTPTLKFSSPTLCSI
ncbi:hypothetical protein C0J52_05529 [Blattella germanica]|nr:hypothetical protein C0J52_05529 [Blattella germanica]